MLREEEEEEPSEHMKYPKNINTKVGQWKCHKKQIPTKNIKGKISKNTALKCNWSETMMRAMKEWINDQINVAFMSVSEFWNFSFLFLRFYVFFYVVDSNCVSPSFSRTALGFSFGYTFSNIAISQIYVSVLT